MSSEPPVGRQNDLIWAGVAMVGQAVHPCRPLQSQALCGPRPGHNFRSLLTALGLAESIDKCKNSGSSVCAELPCGVAGTTWGVSYLHCSFAANI